MSPALLLIVGILGVVGFVMLLVVGFGMLRDERSDKKDTPPDQAAGEASLPAPGRSLGSLLGRPASRAGASASPSAASPEGTSGAGAHEVLRIMRDNLTGRLFVEMAGKRYLKIGDLQDPDIGQAFLTTLRDLQEFARGAGPGYAPVAHGLPAARQHEPGPLAAAVPERPLTPSTPPSPAAAPRPTSPAAPRSVGQPPPLSAPSMNPFKQMQVLRDMAKNPPPAPKTITEQIDEILQARLMETPHHQRGIRMHAGPKGNAIFNVDGAAYEAVDEVPDLEVRAIIRAAIAEWEKSQ